MTILWLCHFFPNLSCWRRTQQVDGRMSAAELNTVNQRLLVAFSNCHRDRKYANLHRMTTNCSNERAARAARWFFLIRPIKFVICDIVVDVPVFDAKLSCWRFIILKWYSYLYINILSVNVLGVIVTKGFVSQSVFVDILRIIVRIDLLSSTYRVFQKNSSCKKILSMHLHRKKFVLKSRTLFFVHFNDALF